MTLTFTIAPADPILIHLTLTGDLTLGPQLSDFARKAAAALTTCKPAGTFLHLAGLEQIDSAGLGELVILYTQAKLANKASASASSRPPPASYAYSKPPGSPASSPSSPPPRTHTGVSTSQGKPKPRRINRVAHCRPCMPVLPCMLISHTK